MNKPYVKNDRPKSFKLAKFVMYEIRELQLFKKLHV